MDYKVSVIIPTYNAENSIRDAIDSIVSQTLGFENIELIVVDDNSSDNTGAIINEFASLHENIRPFFLKDNSGSASRGRNVGIDNASSKYVMFLDQDDRYVDDVCEVLFNGIEGSNLDIAMCNHKTVLNSRFEDVSQLDQDYSFMRESHIKNESLFKNIYMWDKIFRLEFLKENGIRCPEGMLSEDMVFCVNAYLNTSEIINFPEYYGYLYNIRDSKEDSSTSNSITKEKFDKLLEGYYETIDLFKGKDKGCLIPCVMKTHYITLISSFIVLDVDENGKMDCLERIYEFRKYAHINYELNESWANAFDRNIEKRNFKRVILYSKIFKLFYNLDFLRKVYRKFYNKIN